MGAPEDHVDAAAGHAEGVLRLRDGDLSWRAIDDEIVALDVRSSVYLAVNSTGAELWPLLAAGARREQLIERLRSVFTVDEATAAHDVDAFLGVLRDRDLLSG